MMQWRIASAALMPGAWRLLLLLSKSSLPGANPAPEVSQPPPLCMCCGYPHLAVGSGRDGQPTAAGALTHSRRNDGGARVVASTWEIATKRRLGRLPGAEPIINAYADHFHMLRAQELPISSEHALKAGSFQVERRDPFDWKLAAQAILESLPFATDDQPSGSSRNSRPSGSPAALFGRGGARFH